MRYAAGEPVTVRRRIPAGLDEYGNAAFTDLSAVVPGCAFSPGLSAETVQGRDLTISQPIAYLPAGTAVAGIDGLTVRGVRYEVDGVPNVWRSPFTGVTRGIEVRLKGVTG